MLHFFEHDFYCYLVFIYKYYPLMLTVGSFLHICYRWFVPPRIVKIFWLERKSSYFAIFFQLHVMVYINSVRILIISALSFLTRKKKTNHQDSAVALLILILGWLLVLFVGVRLIYFIIVYRILRELITTPSTRPKDLLSIAVNCLNTFNKNIGAYYFGNTWDTFEIWKRFN